MTVPTSVIRRGEESIREKCEGTQKVCALSCDGLGGEGFPGQSQVIGDTFRVVYNNTQVKANGRI